MMTPTIITIQKIMEVHLEAKGNKEIKILVDLTEVKIPEAKAKGIKIHTKANIKATIIKAMHIKLTAVSIITHAEDIIKVIVMANLEAEALVEVEEIIVAVAMAGPILKVVTNTNTISIIVY